VLCVLDVCVLFLQRIQTWVILLGDGVTPKSVKPLLEDLRNCSNEIAEVCCVYCVLCIVYCVLCIV
jgi:hypothetical protein